MPERSNQDWLEQLGASGPVRDAALADLRRLIVASLPYAISQPGVVDEAEFGAFAEDVAQEALLKVLAHIGSFQGRSRFTTWVLKISVRVAFTELRQRRWKDVSLDELEAGYGRAQAGPVAERKAGPERTAEQSSMAALIGRMMAEELTERQRRAMDAMLRGMPLEEIARRLGTERNALYKLLHDGRLRLRRRLAQEGLTPGEVMALFERE
jgi:RNA polymerase sigma-70 factor, ECF subfamily